ncbi:MAG TPA: NUDIX hydrolase [Jatrophihabitantaceae bacterium]|jgi:8-oxo-dGTP pyrophosphatase MutT (NUDIX family)|nr:NUDIX hydrolase [Jatrophihabitantaceae bacterium]
MSTRYPVLSSEKVFQGKVIGVRVDQVRMPDGAIGAREIVSHPGAVGIVAVDDADRLILVRQYRPAVGEWFDELPAGLLDVHGEPALEAAQRELYEEAAVRAADWQVLLDLHTSPGMTNEVIRIYLARELTDVADGERHAAEGEELELTVRRVPLDDAVAEALAGTLTNAAAVAGVLAAGEARSSNWKGLRSADAPWPARPGR